MGGIISYESSSAAPAPGRPTRALRRATALAFVAGMLCVWATCSLGFWQLRRAAAKESLQQAIDAAAQATPVSPDAAALRDPAALVHRHLTLTGQWLPDRVVYLDNRPREGQAGFYVLMPLRIGTPVAADVVVNRGWIPRSAGDRTRIAPYATPTGPVTVSGVVLADEQRLLELMQPGDRPLGGIWQNFDFGAYARASGRAPLSMIVREDAPVGAGREPGVAQDDGLKRDWPDRGAVLQGQIDRHHGYAFQWFAVATALIVLLLYQTYRIIDGRARPRR